MSAAYRHLHRRLMLVFTGFTLVVATLFAFYGVVFMYTVEDRFFAAQLEEEASFQLRERASTDAWAPPRGPHIRLHREPDTFPDDLLPDFSREPWRVEFPGHDGRHYHLRRIEAADGATAWLVAETSAQLVVRPMRNRIFRLLAWTAIIVAALSVAVGYWLAHRIAAPLSRLAATVDSMRPEELPERLPGRYPNDEVGVLARGLESLIRRIRDFIAREQEFTRDASHELRTPLAVIRSAGERLATEAGLGDSARQHLDHIRGSAAQLEQTVATLLALAREENTDTAMEPARILPVLERVVVEQSGLIEDKPVTVEVRVPADATLPVPGPVLHIVLSNLIGNAFAHSDAGEVRIDVERASLRIANHGHPIDPGLKASLHEPFAKRAGSEGFGLGLTIVSRLCRRHGLALEIECHDEVTVASISAMPFLAASAAPSTPSSAPPASTGAWPLPPANGRGRP